MIFFAGLVSGAVVGALIYRFFYTLQCSNSQVVCNESEKEKEISRQLERLIAYGNDL